jgi:hypothetical protein
MHTVLGIIGVLAALAFIAFAFRQGFRVPPREGPPDQTDGGRRLR